MAIRFPLLSFIISHILQLVTCLSNIDNSIRFEGSNFYHIIGSSLHTPSYINENYKKSFTLTWRGRKRIPTFFYAVNIHILIKMFINN